MRCEIWRWAMLLLGFVNCGAPTLQAAAPGLPTQSPNYLSPVALVSNADGKLLYVACATARQVLVFDTAVNKTVQRVEVPESPSGLALSKDNARLYVTCAGASSSVCIVAFPEGKVIGQIRVGHTAMAPVLSPDEKTLYVCNRFNNDVSVIDLMLGKETKRIKVSREPVAAAVTPDGKYLFVANHLHNRQTDGPGVAGMVSVIDTGTGSVARKIQLPRGSGLVRGIAVSPNGRFAAVTHLAARYYLPTTEVDFGHINANIISLLDVEQLRLFRTMYVDYSGLGAANPWAITWTGDSKTLAVTQAGTHEVSLMDVPAVKQKPVRSRCRIALPGNGPRALTIAGTNLYVANYFSDNLCRIDLTAPEAEAEALELGPPLEMSKTRRGEMLFNDARLCYQGWQSCASCHDCDARMDGINWDLLNDGQGNAKNAKSLVWAHQTPPAMWMGVRTTAEAAVRAGIRHILFTEQPEEVAVCIDEYLKSLQPMPGPYLVNGNLSPAAERGRQLFMRAETGCAQCHLPPFYTDLRSHDVGTIGRDDRPTDRFDTPTLVELWRTAPYLHDGSASRMEEVLTSRNATDRHGRTTHLTPDQIADLAEFLLSL